MMMRFLKKLNWVHVAIILILPIILALINPNWMFNLSSRPGYPVVDDYIYTGYQMALPQYIGWEPSNSHYFIDRINWILPVYLLHQIFSPMVVHLLVHLMLYYSACFLIYGILHQLSNSRLAIVAVVLFGQYPLIMRSLGWNYSDGYSMIWFGVCVFLLTYAIQSPYRPFYLVGAGMSFMMMTIAQSFNVFYAPALAIYFFLLDTNLFQKPLRLFRVGFYTLLGAILCFLIWAILYYAITGRILLANTLEGSRDLLVRMPSLLRNTYGGGIIPYWHVFLMIIIFLALQRISKRSGFIFAHNRQQIYAGLGLFIGSYGVILFWLVLGYFYTHLGLYHANVIFSAFIALVILFEAFISNLDSRQFRTLLLSAIIAPMLPFLFFSFINHQLLWIILYSVAGIGSIACCIYLLRQQNPFRASIGVIVLVVFSCIMIGTSQYIRTYNPNRYEEQSIFERTISIIQLINQRYDKVSTQDFRLLFDSNDPNLPVFQSVRAVYLWIWGRYEDLNTDKLNDEFLSADSIIVLSSLSNRAHTENLLTNLGFNLSPDDEIILADIVLMFYMRKPFIESILSM